MYVYNWIPLLYTWNQHNIVNQLYSSIKWKFFLERCCGEALKPSCSSFNPTLDALGKAFNISLLASEFFTESQGKPENTGVGSLSLLQSIFLTQESNWGLLLCRQILYQLSYQGSSHTYIWRYINICLWVYLDSTYEWYHTVFVFFWLTLFSMIFSRSTHLAAKGIISFFVIAE